MLRANTPTSPARAATTSSTPRRWRCSPASANRLGPHPAQVDAQPRAADVESRLSQSVRDRRNRGRRAAGRSPASARPVHGTGGAGRCQCGDSGSLFLYGGPVGEPALGPSAFMHRGSAQYNPEAPITHHWFDSTHITYGVVTAGFASGRSCSSKPPPFAGEEPDEQRWDIETPALDSWSVRATMDPSPRWAMQVSHGGSRARSEPPRRGRAPHHRRGALLRRQGPVRDRRLPNKNRQPGAG